MQRSLRASRLECGLLGLVRPRTKVAEAGPEVIAEQEQQQEGQKRPEQELRGRRREVLPLQVLKHYAAGMGWQYETEPVALP